MSRAPTSRSPDLERLRDEGYDLSLVGGSLVVRGIPFVDADRRVGRGALVVPLALSADRTTAPRGHHVFWTGGRPCDWLGRPLAKVVAGPMRRKLASGVEVDHVLCNRPHGREFRDHHELVTTYVALISGHAARLDPAASARTERGAIAVEDDRSPFRYVDTATARAGIGSLSERFGGSVAIVGLGGTGGYVLDLVAKTPVATIHLIDGDVFDQHNAFRAPGAASLDELRARRAKVHHMADIYSRMHTGIVPHPLRLGPADLGILDHAGFVFLCMDDAAAKRPIIERLERDGKPFIDVGIGVEYGERGLFGSVRVTTSTPTRRHHVRESGRIPLDGGDGADAYGSNIQVADLNMLNAALAVIRWKKLIGFYADGGGEHHSIYDLDANRMINTDV